MSVDDFCRSLPNLPVGKNDRVWFPRWIRRYAGFLKQARDQTLRVDEAELVQFLRSLRDAKLPAWQRLQAARAIEAYRQHVLGTTHPSLVKIKQTLQRLAAQERQQPGSRQTDLEPVSPGVLRDDEPQVVRQLRAELRRLRYRNSTEKAYVGWVKRFIGHCQSPELDGFGEPQIKSFLTQLAVEGNVTASTQKQAQSALLFLYQKVLGRELGFLDATRATRPERLPVVLSRPEIEQLLTRFTGMYRLMFCLMYGSGLRHKECRRLRVKDVHFDQGHIVVRSDPSFRRWC